MLLASLETGVPKWAPGRPVPRMSRTEPIVTEQNTVKPTRRVLALLAALVPAFSLFRHIRPTEHDDIVEVEGWSLKRSDLP